MRIQQTEYGRWRQAYRCLVGSVEMVVVTEIGPRIISLRLDGGENILHEDTAGFAFGLWRIYGGHRFTLAPENQATYEPDNEPCQVNIEGDRLRVLTPPGPSRVQKILEVQSLPQGGGFEVRHLLHNTGDFPWYGAPWAITCVKPGGRVVAPWGCGSGRWRNNMVRYWSRFGDYDAPVDSPQWRPMNQYFVVEPTGETGKIGLYAEPGWLALLRPEGTFVKRAALIAPEAAYPDQGCNLEIYTCADFMELETLGPLAVLPPGEQLAHVEYWRLTDKRYGPEEWAAIGEFSGVGSAKL